MKVVRLVNRDYDNVSERFVLNVSQSKLASSFFPHADENTQMINVFNINFIFHHIMISFKMIQLYVFML